MQSAPVDPGVGGFGGGTYPAFGQVVLAGSQWLNGHGVDVHSNGCNGCGSSQADWNLDGADGYAWQCVELFERLINDEGWYHGLVPTSPPLYAASSLYAGAPASAFVQYPNGSGYVPVPGDAVIFTGETYGHVAIVNWVPAHDSFRQRTGAWPRHRNGDIRITRVCGGRRSLPDEYDHRSTMRPCLRLRVNAITLPADRVGDRSTDGESFPGCGGANAAMPGDIRLVGDARSRRCRRPLVEYQVALTQWLAGMTDHWTTLIPS